MAKPTRDRAAHFHDIIVMGASSGGTDAFRRLLPQLSPDFPAAIFIVQHMVHDAPLVLDDLLNQAGPLPSKFADDGEAIVPSRIYIARPDCHLLLHDGHLRVARGPRENRCRPSIDPLFRSAAAAYGTRVIGVILTGTQDDGCSGLAAVKRCGGVTVVQDPDDATFPELPRNALLQLPVDHCVPVGEMGEMLNRLVREPARPAVPIPNDIAIEARIAEQAMRDPSSREKLGKLSGLGCPECGGPLWTAETDGIPRYRCAVGHAYTAQTLLTDQDLGIERALWAALRTMEEQSRMLARLAKDSRLRNMDRAAVLYEERAAESKADADVIRELLSAPHRVDIGRARPEAEPRRQLPMSKTI